MKEKKVLFLTRLYHPHVGGVERHIEYLSSELAKRGYKITIITGAHENKLKREEIYKGNKIIHLFYPKLKLIGLLKIWLEMIRNIRYFIDADIVHIHDVFIWYLPLRLILPKKEVFMTFHGYPYYPLKKRAICLQNLAYKLTRANISVGEFIPKWYGTRVDIITYGAVDLSKFKPVKKKKYKYDAVFSSRLDEQTGILTYIDAIKILKKRGIDLKLVVLGEGKYMNSAKKYAKCLGFVKDPSKYFNQSKYAFVNRYLSVLEAIASEKLVFAVYDNPLKKDYLYLTPYKDWIVIEKSPEKLAEKIIYYQKNPNMAKSMIESAHRWVQNQTWSKMADNYETLWKL